MAAAGFLDMNRKQPSPFARAPGAPANFEDPSMKSVWKKLQGDLGNRCYLLLLAAVFIVALMVLPSIMGSGNSDSSMTAHVGGGLEVRGR